MTRNETAGETAKIATGKYSLAVVQVMRRYVEVDAASGDEAMSKVEAMVANGEIVLGREDVESVEVQPDA